MSRNIYQELQDKICDSKIDKNQKVGMSLNLFSIFLQEKAYNDSYETEFEKLKELLSKETGFDFTQLDSTKLNLWNQATSNYRPSMCDSSQMGTTNQYYLRQIATLFTNNSYLLDDDGEIIPILWNINENADDDAIEYNRNSEIWTKRLLNFGKTSDKVEGYYGLQPVSELPWFRTMKYFFEWIENVLGLEVTRLGSDNTYNYDGLFVAQFNLFKVEEDGFEHTYCELEIHIGADVRGGYSDPVIYEYFGEYKPTILNSNEDIQFYCPDCHQDSMLYYQEEKRLWNKDRKAFLCQNIIKIEQKLENGNIHRQQTLVNNSVDDTKVCNGELNIYFR